MSFPDDCGYSLKFDTGTFSSLFLEYYLFTWLSRVFVGACRIFCCGAQTRQLWCMGCVFTACGIRNQGSNPMSPASQSRFVTSGPPGKSDSHIIFVTKIEIKHAVFSSRFSRRAVFPWRYYRILCLTSPWKAGEIENQHLECLTLFFFS